MSRATFVPMSVGRLRFVHGLIAILVGWSLYCITTDSEYWPFSQYEMYSLLATPGDWSQVQLFGIKESDPSREVPFKRRSYIRPFDWVRLKRAFERLEERPDGAARLEEALGDLLTRYEARRAAGRQRGPRFIALKLYRYTWHDVRPDKPHAMESVGRKDLLAEVRLSPAEGR